MGSPRTLELDSKEQPSAAQVTWCDRRSGSSIPQPYGIGTARVGASSKLEGRIRQRLAYSIVREDRVSCFNVRIAPEWFGSPTIATKTLIHL